MKYFTFVYETTPFFARLTQEPFVVLARVLGRNALISFDDDGLALAQQILAEAGQTGWCADEQRNCYDITANGVTKNQW
jgi:hypothetical protein